MRTRRAAWATTIVLVVAAVVVAALVLTFAVQRVSSSSHLVLENPTLIFSDPGAVSFAVSGASASVTWSVADEGGHEVVSGTAEPDDGSLTIDVAQRVPTGYYTVTLSSPSDGDVTAAFGVTGPAPADDRYYSVQTLSAHPNSVYSVNMDRLIPMLKGLGFSSRRDSVYWSQFELSAGEYSTPPSIQRTLDEDDQNDMSLVWTAGSGNPLYDGGRLPSSPEAIRAYAKYIDAFLTAHPHVTTVEMLNEFNGTNNSACGATAACYLDIAKVVYPFVKSRHPDVVIVAGGLAGVSLDWWRDFFSAGGIAYGDAFSYHPYGLTPQRLGEVADEITRLIKKNNRGVGKPLYMTEVGWSISTEQKGNPAKVGTEEQQADRLVYSFIAPQASPQIALVNWYQALDYGPTETEYNFGLFRQATDNVKGFQPKKAAVAFYVLRSQLDGFHYVRTDTLAGDVQSYVFSNDKGVTTRVMWRTTRSSADTSTTSVTLPATGKAYLTVTSVDGARLAAVTGTAASSTQEVSTSPIFVTTSDSPPPAR